VFTQNTSFLLISLSLAACGGVPGAEGAWQASSPVLVSDECALDVILEIDEDWTSNLTLEYGEDKGTFTLTNTDGDVADCEMDGDPAFGCTTELVFDFSEGVDDLPPLDAVITMTSVTDGEFVGESAATGRSTFTGVCVGDACDVLLGFVDVEVIPNPCTSVVDLEYALVE
jgi:hypothetical protein